MEPTRYVFTIDGQRHTFEYDTVGSLEDTLYMLDLHDEYKDIVENRSGIGIYGSKIFRDPEILNKLVRYGLKDVPENLDFTKITRSEGPSLLIMVLRIVTDGMRGFAALKPGEGSKVQMQTDKHSLE